MDIREPRKIMFNDRKITLFITFTLDYDGKAHEAVCDVTMGDVIPAYWHRNDYMDYGKDSDGDSGHMNGSWRTFSQGIR